MISQIIIGPFGHFKISGVAIQAVSGGIRPQNPGVEYKSFVRLRVCPELMVDLPDKSAVHRVNGVIDPIE
ncbi:hypothetical protein D1872_229390 [compost metagenome]